MKKPAPNPIGVDPGVKNTGVGIWDRGSRQFIVLIKLPWWEAFEFAATAALFASHTRFRVEDPSQNKPVFREHLSGQDLKNSLAIAQRVGMNKIIARLFIEGLERKNYQVEAVKPSTTKWNADEFRRFTRYKGQTNEHTRDAGRLVYDF